MAEISTFHYYLDSNVEMKQIIFSKVVEKFSLINVKLQKNLDLCNSGIGVYIYTIGKSPISKMEFARFLKIGWAKILIFGVRHLVFNSEKLEDFECVMGQKYPRGILYYGSRSISKKGTTIFDVTKRMIESPNNQTKKEI